MTAQEQFRKMLEKEFAFEFVSSKETGFGERWVLRCAHACLEAQLGVHRVCFYAGKPQANEFDNNLVDRDFPSLLRPLCFHTDERAAVRAYLEKTLQIKSKTSPRQARLFAVAEA